MNNSPFARVHVHDNGKKFTSSLQSSTCHFSSLLLALWVAEATYYVMQFIGQKPPPPNIPAAAVAVNDAIREFKEMKLVKAPADKQDKQQQDQAQRIAEKAKVIAVAAMQGAGAAEVARLSQKKLAAIAAAAERMARKQDEAEQRSQQEKQLCAEQNEEIVLRGLASELLVTIMNALLPFVYNHINDSSTVEGLAAGDPWHGYIRDAQRMFTDMACIDDLKRNMVQAFESSSQSSGAQQPAAPISADGDEFLLRIKVLAQNIKRQLRDGLKAEDLTDAQGLCKELGNLTGFPPGILFKGPMEVQQLYLRATGLLLQLSEIGLIIRGNPPVWHSWNVLLGVPTVTAEPLARSSINDSSWAAASPSSSSSSSSSAPAATNAEAVGTASNHAFLRCAINHILSCCLVGAEHAKLAMAACMVIGGYDWQDGGKLCQLSVAATQAGVAMRRLSDVVLPHIRKCVYDV